MSWTPQDLPYLRDKTVEHTHTYATEEVFGEEAATMLRFADELLATPLTWLDTDVSELIATTLDSLPAWSPAAAMPGSAGIIAYEHPPVTIPLPVTDTTQSITIDAIQWIPHEAGTMKIRALSRLTGISWPLAGLIPAPPLAQVMAITGVVDATIGDVADFDGIDEDEKQLLALAGATWLLMSQPTVVEDDTPVVITRKPRKNRVVSAPRVMVSTKRLSHRLRDHSKRGTGRKATKRWWVRGHWRQQPWGKGQKLRKPIWIAPHTSGATDGPMDDTPRVQVWRK